MFCPQLNYLIVGEAVGGLDIKIGEHLVNRGGKRRLHVESLLLSEKEIEKTVRKERENKISESRHILGGRNRRC
jgi:hypothetical protein